MICGLSDIKQHQFDMEKAFLSPFASKSDSTKGREKEEAPCPIRTEYQRDRDRILHSKSFRRLKHKTQVFLAPVGDHYRTRMTHTLEVSQIARTIARALHLNEDLTEAISLGHDLGHTPFGHTGEEVLNELLGGGFRHNEQSVRVVKVLENLNLTYETIDGILNHTGDLRSASPEGKIVKIADRIAYLNHDIDDGVRAKVISCDDIPEKIIKTLGGDTNSRITAMVKDIILNSKDSADVKMSKEIGEVTTELRSWMFDKVYLNPEAIKENNKAKKILTDLYDYYLKNPQTVESSSEDTNIDLERKIADYIAGMTDRYALNQYSKIFIPSFCVNFLGCADFSGYAP
jgi:dGTPase